MDIFIADGLALLMAALIAIVAITIISFSRRYMDGDRHQASFFKILTALTATTLILVFANHVAVFLAAWLIMGLLLAKLIGHVKGWQQAQAAAKIARHHFMWGAIALAASLAMMVWQTGQWTLSGIMDQASALDPIMLWTAGGLALIAAMVQSALFPFHKWILSSMTAPTPVSAFMHAGLVNAGGFLIVRFAPVFAAIPEILLIVFALGAFTALLASFWMLTQNDVKRSLGCSTVAQMGFMVMQCGLGLYSAAITHLILHGFYKAYHFLAAGSSIQGPKLPVQTKQNYRVSIPFVVIGGATAAYIFAALTGKTITTLDSATILVAFAAIAGAQAGHGLAALTHVSIPARALMTVTIVAAASALYAVIFTAITTIMPINDPQPLSWLHLATLAIFTIGWLSMILGAHKQSKRAFMNSLNAAQPQFNSVVNHRSTYNAG